MKKWLCVQICIEYGWEFYHVDLYEQILKHDNSKYESEEFNAYRKNYFPVNTEEKELNKKDFEAA